MSKQNIAPLGLKSLCFQAPLFSLKTGPSATAIASTITVLVLGHVESGRFDLPTAFWSRNHKVALLQ